MHALRRYWKAGACAHDPACVLMRTRTENACSTRLIRSDGCAVCTCTYRKHAACIRRYFACANDSAGVRMRNRTHIACAARFRTVVVTLVSRVVSKMYAMANMVLILSCSCHAIRRRAHDLSARAAGTTGVYAGARMATWCTGVCVTVSTCTCALRCVRVALYLRVRCVCATGALLPPAVYSAWHGCLNT